MREVAATGVLTPSGWVSAGRRVVLRTGRLTREAARLPVGPRRGTGGFGVGRAVRLLRDDLAVDRRQERLERARLVDRPVHQRDGVHLDVVARQRPTVGA